MTVELSRQGEIAVVTINNGPVNALSNCVRQELWDFVDKLNADPDVSAVVLTGAGRLFVGGADINELDRSAVTPFLPDLIAKIEWAGKPWVAAMHGRVIGGGLELALGCHIRVAMRNTRFALPEVSLGLIPGAGGTQRLPRLIGVDAAIPIVAEMEIIDADRAAELGLVDHLVGPDVVNEAVEIARDACGKSLTPGLSARQITPPEEAIWKSAHGRLSKNSKTMKASQQALEAMRCGVDNGFAAGMARERETFLRLRESKEAAALRYLFFAERAALRPLHLRGVEPLVVERVGVVGGGTMGVGIVAALAAAGLQVVLIERGAAQLDHALKAAFSIFETAARKGLIDTTEMVARQSRISGQVGYVGLESCDLIIEAVFEELSVKREVFAALSKLCRPETILVTNTSYLDPRQISDGIIDSGRFLGLHFFSPAHIMKLLEIVPIPETRPAILATVFALGRRLGKVSVQSGISEGFIGNRILRRYRAAAEAVLLEGVPPFEIDATMRNFGFKMGPFESQDLAGLDIAFLQREAARAKGEAVPNALADVLVRAGRKGQKTNGGWYDYEPGSSTPEPAPDVERLLSLKPPKTSTITGEEIVERLLGAMADEGHAIVAEGIANQASDVDLVMTHGFGFPREKGGPMFSCAFNKAYSVAAAS